MRIAAHHRPDTPENALSQRIHPSPAYEPQQPWPDDCTVQWGNGIIPATPFFEAFIPGTFIRGEGATIGEAEAKAFAQYRSEQECDHLWGRQRPGRQLYTNGAGWCRRCGAFRANMFKPIAELGHMRRPLSWMEGMSLQSMEEDEELNARMDAKYPNERAERLRHARILRLRANLFGIRERDASAGGDGT